MLDWKNYSTRRRIAFYVAILFLGVGAWGLQTQYRDFFLQNTALNLVLMAGLLVWTQEGKDRSFWLFAVLAFTTGMVTEMIGVNTGYLFGNYVYGTVMGPKLHEVPYLIGVNWFVVMLVAGTTIQILLNGLWQRNPDMSLPTRTRLTQLSIVVDGALLATVFDWIMEPVAVKLGFWTWLGTGEIPLWNYVCWFGISALLMAVFQACSFPKRNLFAVHLLIIQTLFFLILRSAD
jgi:putative membrane protein